MWYGGALFCQANKCGELTATVRARAVAATEQRGQSVQSHFFVFVVYQAQFNCATSTYGYQLQQVLTNHLVLTHSLHLALQTTSKAPHLSLCQTLLSLSDDDDEDQARKRRTGGARTCTA